MTNNWEIFSKIYTFFQLFVDFMFIKKNKKF